MIKIKVLLSDNTVMQHTQPASAPSPHPTLLDRRYDIISTVKSGAMGCIYRARDTRLNIIVAVKKMLPFFHDRQEEQYGEARFREEVRLLSTLRHAGLPRVTDYFIIPVSSGDAPGHYLVMDFIEGRDLETLIQERGQKPFPSKEVIAYAEQILDILNYLHTRTPPIIYRDLNPRNIMISEKKVFLVDFGIARVFFPHQKGTAIGTPGYAAPEQYKGEAVPGSDLYSLGAVLHYLLTGQNPEDSRSPLFSFVPPRRLNPDVPEGLANLVLSMVHFSAGKRPFTAREAAMSLSAPAARPSPAGGARGHKDIFKAIESDDLEAVRAFIRLGAGINRRKGFIRRTPLHWAAQQGHRDIAEELIAGGADINAEEFDGYTPLHNAASCGHAELVMLLVERGAHINASSRLANTPLKLALQHDYDEIADILRSRGAREK